MVSASVTLTHLPSMVSPSCGAAVARVMSESRARKVLIGVGLAYLTSDSLSFLVCCNSLSSHLGVLFDFVSDFVSVVPVLS